MTRSSPPKKTQSVGSKKTVPQGTLCPTCGKIHQKCAAHRRKIRDENGKPIPCNQSVSREEIRIAREEGRGAVCRRLHGGNKLVGPANPNFRHGRKSNPRFLPTRYLDDADKIGNDPELGSMRHAIIVQELRIEELMRKLDDLPASSNSDDIHEALTDAKMALEIGDIAEASEYVEAALQVSNNHSEEERTIWEEIRKTHKIMTSMVDSERKRQIVVQDYVPRRQLIFLAREIIKTASKYIPDPHAFSQFTIEMSNRIGSGSALSESNSILDAEFRRLGGGDSGGQSMNDDTIDDDDGDNNDDDNDDNNDDDIINATTYDIDNDYDDEYEESI